MRQARHERLVRRALLAVWGMATVVLGFLVIILVWVLLAERQESPANAAPVAVTAPLPPRSPTSPVSSREITLYFVDAEGLALLPEAAQIEFNEFTVENCRKALEALIKGPRGGLTPVLPASVQLSSLFLLDSGELVVNFSMELETELKKYRSASVESLMVQSVVNTVMQPALRGADGASVKSVRFLIQNAPPRESFPAHIDVSMPVVSNTGWVAVAQSSNGQG